jgi:hypothetical protein
LKGTATFDRRLHKQPNASQILPMPSYSPRDEPVKKQEELLKHLRELKYAIERKDSPDKINKAAEKIRKANLSLYKAQSHVAREKQFQNKPFTLTIEKIESEIIKWKTLSVDDIIKSVK